MCFKQHYHLVTEHSYENMVHLIIVHLPITHGDFPVPYVKLSEAKLRKHSPPKASSISSSSLGSKRLTVETVDVMRKFAEFPVMFCPEKHPWLVVYPSEK